MNENYKYELSEIHPRKPPERYGYQNLPRVQLMVPEPSIIANNHLHTIENNSDNGPSKPSRKPLRDLSRMGLPNTEMRQPNYQHSLNNSKTEPVNYYASTSVPSHPISSNAFDKKKIIDHDLSVSMYSKIIQNEREQGVPYAHKSFNTVEKENENMSLNNFENSKPAESHAEVTVPVDVLAVLNKQSEEISTLRRQLQDLTNQLIASATNSLKKQDEIPQLNSGRQRLPSKLQGSIPSEVSGENILKSDASTQTSPPPSPKRAQEVLRNSSECQHIRKSNSLSFFQVEDTKNDHNRESIQPDELKHDAPITVNDLEIAPPRLTSFNSNEIYIKDNSLEERQRIHNISIERNANFNPIDMSNEVKCVDLCPPEDIRKNINDFKNIPQEIRIRDRPLSRNEQVQVLEPTILQRTRQLGISFLTPEDFNKKSEASPKNNHDDYSCMFLPKAAQFCSPSISQFTSKESMIQNSTALKNLNDEQLTLLAKTRMPDKENYRYSSNQKFTHDDIMKPSELTQYGISEKNLSESTIQYLEKNRLKK